jgi:hypothetical protein
MIYAGFLVIFRKLKIGLMGYKQKENISDVKRASCTRMCFKDNGNYFIGVTATNIFVTKFVFWNCVERNRKFSCGHR